MCIADSREGLLAVEIHVALMSVPPAEPLASPTPVSPVGAAVLGMRLLMGGQDGSLLLAVGSWQVSRLRFAEKIFFTREFDYRGDMLKGQKCALALHAVTRFPGYLLASDELHSLDFAHLGFTQSEPVLRRLSENHHYSRKVLLEFFRDCRFFCHI